MTQVIPGVLVLCCRYPDKDGRPKMRPVGTVHVHSARPGPDDGTTLSKLKFQIGDFMDVAIHI